MIAILYITCCLEYIRQESFIPLKVIPLKASKFVWLLPNGDVISKSNWSILYMSRASELKTSADLMLDHWVRPAGLASFQFTDRLCWEAHARSHLHCSFHHPSSALSSFYLQKCLTGWIVINLTLTSPLQLANWTGAVPNCFCVLVVLMLPPQCEPLSFKANDAASLYYVLTALAKTRKKSTACFRKLWMLWITGQQPLLWIMVV